MATLFNAFPITVKDIEIEVTGSEISTVNPIKARINNSNLHVTGLTVGKTLKLYSAAGALVYQSVVVSEEMIIPMDVHGVYVIKSEESTLKVIY